MVAPRVHTLSALGPFWFPYSFSAPGHLKGQTRCGPACQGTGTGGGGHKSEGPSGGWGDECRPGDMALPCCTQSSGRDQAGGCDRAERPTGHSGAQRRTGSVGPAEPAQCQRGLPTTGGDGHVLGHMAEAHTVLGSAQVPTSAQHPGPCIAQVAPGHATHPAQDQTRDPLNLQFASQVLQSVPVFRFFINLNCFSSQLRHISRRFLYLKT